MNDKVVVSGDANLRNIIDGQPFAYYKGGGGTNRHDLLINRDWDDQHPISAITQLMQELSVRPTETLSNTDIQNILNH